MEKFKPTVIAKEFITAASDALVTQNALVFNDGVGSSTILTDDQALNNNYKNSQSISKDVPTSVSGYKNVDTNTIVANVKISNKTLSADVRISTILIYASYNGNNILAATARLNAPELLPAYDTDKGTPVTLEFAVYMQVSNNINAPVQFNEAGLATSADLRTVDASSVHKSGDETIDGIKKFLKPINGTAEITIHYLWDDLDLNTLVDNSVYVANNVKVLQSSVKENFIMRVEAGNSKFPVKQTKYSFDTGMTYVRYQNNGSWTNFIKQPTDDSVLVHLFGDETIDGNKTFLKNIATTSDNSMINGGGNDKSLALVKQSGTQPFVAFGNTNQVQIKKSNNTVINPTDTFRTILNITDNGQVNVGNNQDLVPLDKNVAHKSGDETIDGNKKFLQPIIGGLSTRNLNFKISDITDNLSKYVGIWAADPSITTDIPENSWGIIKISNFGPNSGVIEFFGTATNISYQLHVQAGKYDNWIKIANDSTVVHNTGDETVKGTKTFEKPINGNVTGEAAVANYKNNLLSDNSDVASIAVSGYYYARNANGISGLPKEFNAKYFDLSAWVNGSNGFMIIVDDSNNIYFRKRQNGSWQDYTPMPLDATKLPRNDRQETIHETWKFEKDIDGTANYSKQPVLFDIADGTDLNNIKTSGSYSCGTNRVGNSPINNWFSLVVVQNGSFNGVQTLTDTNNGEVYTRTWNNSGSWFSPWEKLSSDSKVVHNSGNETIYDKKTFDAVTTFNNGIVNKPISMNGFKIDVSKLVSGTYNVWQGDISGCPADYGIVEVFENVSNTMYRFTQTNLPDVHVWIQLKNSGGFTGWKQQM